MPKSRRERALLEKQKGAEFFSPSELTPEQKCVNTYAGMLADGVPHEVADKATPIPPAAPTKSLRERAREWEKVAKPKIDGDTIRWTSREDLKK